MPSAPKTHRQLINERMPRRPSACKRGYGRRWEKLRRMVLRRQPLCQWPGCNKPATDVDHIVAKPAGDDSFENLQALCHPHHSEKTARYDGAFGR